MAFVSSPGSTNEVNTTYGVSTASPHINTASTQVNTSNLSDATVYAFLADQPNGSHLVHEDLEQIHEDDLEEIDLKWQLTLLSMEARGECRGPRIQDGRYRNQDSSRKNVNVEDNSSKAMVAIDGVDSEVYTDKTCSKTYLKNYETLKKQNDDLRIELNKSKFNLATYKRGLASVEEQLIFYKKNEVIFCDQIGVLKRDVSFKDAEISVLKRMFSPPKTDLSYSGSEEFKQPEFEGYGPMSSKNVYENISDEIRENIGALIIKDGETDIDEESKPKSKVVEKTIESKTIKQDNVSKTVSPTVSMIEFVRSKQQEKLVRKTVKYAEIFDHVQATCKYHQREKRVTGNNYTRVNYNYTHRKTHPSSYKNMVPKAVLMKSGLRPLNSARPKSCFSKLAQSTVSSPIQKKTTLTNRNINQKVNTAKGNINIAQSKAVNTATLNSAIVNAVRANLANAVKASSYWVWRPTKLNSASITFKRH
ncbi:hypothetical protein Tco_1233838, partial [Tanacetum coccineum]